jgi:hypothetical protein
MTWHRRYDERVMQRGREAAPRVDRATFQRGDFGRVIRADGSEQWWVRSGHGAWIALTHQRVIENDDGTITLLYLK